MMKLYKILYLSGVLALFSACSADDEVVTPDSAFEIRNITATIDGATVMTRADAFKSTSVGRSMFANGDTIVFTKIERTKNPIPKFQYSDVRYLYNGANWKRTETTIDNEKLYWSDGHNDHTFIGYCLPQSATYLFDNGDGTFSGQLSTTDFSAGNTAMAKEDILLSYSTTTKAETGGLSTQVSFSHGLSNIHVVVNIKEYAAKSGVVDTNVVVSHMVIGDQPTKFTWDANSANLQEATTSNRKELILYCPNPAGDNSDQNKTFSFYGLTVPHTDTDVVPFEFTVKYNPTDDDSKAKTYYGEFSNDNGIEFNSGKCTTLNITLSHGGEQMHLDVSYNDWNYVATPDLGELRKKSTFMEMTIDKVSRWADGYSVDDATWLYNAGTVAEPIIKDIYGHTGTDSDPYIIKSAAQLLSFAKEVNNGYSFTDKFIRLDADITMQESATATDKSWGGIGVGENSKPFNGTFLGGDRYINRLKGNPLFVKLDSAAVVEQLYINTIGDFTNGVLAGTNNGVIGGCKVIDDVEATGGVLVGTNNNTVYACYYTGDTDKVAGIVGTSSTNQAVGCYMAGQYSLYEMQQSSFIKTLNDALDELYKTNTNLTKFHFTHNAASYPTVTK